MAEQPARYCSNCGQELGIEAQFCQNCGSPTHANARVPTPEADVPVPAPQGQQGSGWSTASTQPQGVTQARGRSMGSKVFIGCLALLALPVLFIGCLALAVPGGDETDAGSAASDQQPQDPAQDGGQSAGEDEPVAAQAGGGGSQPQPRYQLGETATVGNVEWTVNDAFLTDRLRSNFGTQKRGDFVVVDFTFTNNRNEEVTLDPELHMILKDSEGREFGSDLDAWEFVPTDLNIFLEPVNPGLSTDGRVIYEVAPDAAGFRLTLDDVEFLEDKSAVYDLGNISAEAYDPASASASASPAAGQ